MAEQKQWHLVCYDISDQRRWRKAFKLLKGYGHSIQFSIFRCRLNKRQLEQLRWELEKILVPEDRLLIASLCHCCASKVIAKNTGTDLSGKELSYAVY